MLLALGSIVKTDEGWLVLFPITGSADFSIGVFPPQREQDAQEALDLLSLKVAISRGLPLDSVALQLPLEVRAGQFSGRELLFGVGGNSPSCRVPLGHLSLTH